MRDLDIADVARRAGVPASTVRFYEEKGAPPRPHRTGGAGRAAGFSLDEIAEMFGTDGRPRIDRLKLAAKAEELDQTIGTLRAMRDGLRHAVACSAPSHMECPKFRRLLQAATSGALGVRRRRQPAAALGRTAAARRESRRAQGHPWTR